MATEVPPASYEGSTRSDRNIVIWTAKTKISGRGYPSGNVVAKSSDSIVIPPFPMRKIHEIPPDTRT